MRIGVLGISYKSSDLFLREQVTRACYRCFHEESALARHLKMVLLTTCHRTEIYFSAEDLAEAHSDLLAVLRAEISCPFEHHLYSYFSTECFMHLALVSSGFDSAVLAESEIQRQVKEAYGKACLHRELSHPMHFLFQKSLKIGKWVRGTFPQLKGEENLESLVIRLSQLLVGNLKNQRVFFIGNSEIDRKIIARFHRNLGGAMTLCTRSPHSAEELCHQYQMGLTDWSRLSDWNQHEIVIVGTHHANYLIRIEDIQKESKTQLIFDLSVPRTVDPDIATHPQLLLLNMEELGELLEKKQGDRGEFIEKIELEIRHMVVKQIEGFERKTQGAMCTTC